MFDEMVLAREAVAALARAVIHRTVAEDGVVDTGLMTLEICEAGEGLPAVVASERLGRSVDVSDVLFMVGGTVLLGDRRR